MLRKIRNYFQLNFKLQRNPRKRIISFWQKNGADFNYFEAADNPQWLEIFWKPESDFARLFSQLDLERVLEIACGAARHSFQVIDKIKELYLLDTSAGALALAKKRMKGHQHVHFIHHPSGLGLPAIIGDASLTAVFSYDAMVHFEKDTIAAYLAASFRVLKPGGKCLLHYSNYSANPGGNFSDNPGWRNYMTAELFHKYAIEAGFTVIETAVIEFSAPSSDAITLLQKL